MRQPRSTHWLRLSVLVTALLLLPAAGNVLVAWILWNLGG